MPTKHKYEGDNFEFRRKFQKVFMERGTGDVVLRLHETDIVRVRPNGDVILSTGGWATHKTLSSMNDALELFGMYCDCSSGGIPQGRWQVTDSDGSIHDYTNDKQQYMTTIRAKSAEDRSRAQWLAEAYEVPYTPPTARVAQAAAAPQGPRVVSQSSAPAPSAARANGHLAPASQSAPSAVPGVGGGSWANIAKRANPLHAANTGGAVRMTGPGAAAAGGRVTGPGGAAAAAAAGPTAHRTTGPPGFGAAGASSSSAAAAALAAAGGVGGFGSVASPHQPSTATVTSAPPMPVGAQLVAQMAQLGLDQHELEDDSHLCVVCMEEPRSIVLVPCGHMALCKDCCQQIIVDQQSQCPMCCQDVEYHVEVDG